MKRSFASFNLLDLECKGSSDSPDSADGTPFASRVSSNDDLTSLSAQPLKFVRISSMDNICKIQSYCATGDSLEYIFATSFSLRQMQSTDGNGAEPRRKVTVKKRRKEESDSYSTLYIKQNNIASQNEYCDSASDVSSVLDDFFFIDDKSRDDISVVTFKDVGISQYVS